jgi:hypothetical protein
MSPGSHLLGFIRLRISGECNLSWTGIREGLGEGSISVQNSVSYLVACDNRDCTKRLLISSR